MKKAYVFLKKIPKVYPKDTLYPEARQREIDETGNVERKTEKYWAWKLLEDGVLKVFGKSFSSFSFKRSENGKWCTDDFFFSISHGGGYAAVVISDTVCGIDVENEKNLSLDLSKKILTENEISEFNRITSQGEKSLYLLTQWTKKEAIFKSFDRAALLPSSIETDDYITRTMRISPDNTPIIISTFIEGNPDFDFSFL